MNHTLLKYALFLAILSALTTACGAGLLGGSGPLDFLTAATPPPQQFRLIPTTAQSGLETLPGYRADLVLDFEGTYQGQPAQGHLEQVIEVTHQPETHHYYLNLAGELPATADLTSGIAQFFQIGEAVYLRRAGESLWSQFSHPAGSTDTFALPDPRRLMLLPRTVSTPPQRENLNDISVQRYHFSGADLNRPELTISRAEGSVWVATPGDYVVRYVLSATLRLDQPDPSAHFFDEGHLLLRYGLNHITTSLTISPPDNLLTAQYQMSDLPRLPEAHLTTILPALIEYTSPISAISTTLFYRRELGEAEWIEEAADIFNDKAQLTFVKDDQRLTIIIVPADQPGQVKVSLDLSE